MKKTILILLAALLTSGAAFAQEAPVAEKPSHFKLYGFIRNYIAADSRSVKAGTEDLYFYMPMDKDMTNGFDANGSFNWRFVSLTTRLGLDVSGYKWGSMGISGKVEADFYYLSGSVPTLRLRQAFMKLVWDNSPWALTLGQAWHPMAVDMPHMTNLETGAPFNPFSRTPQIRADVALGSGFSLTAGLMYLNHYLPTGPGNTKSKDYFKFGLPEFYFGANFQNEHFLARIGLNMVNMRPYRTHPDWRVQGDDAPVIEVKSLLTTVSPFAFFQYTDGMFQLRAKTILAQGGEHMNLLSGYGVHSFNNDGTISYTPMQDWASFVSFSYGKKFQVMAMLGYMKQLGTTRDLVDNQLWLNTSADTRIQQAFRATPTVAWNLGKFTVSLEYNMTAAQFGNTVAAGFTADAARDARGLFNPAEMHWVLNHRFICMTKFNF
ncbi:MAG: hypothetical protein J5917_03980 [Bacteroidales bacterium]|nr:hypothetical protein [Bacteroidales bacterium]